MVRNLAPRTALAIALFGWLWFLPSFLEHARYFLSGGVVDSVVTGNWLLVGLNVAGFLAVVVLLGARRRIDWTRVTGLGVRRLAVRGDVRRPTDAVSLRVSSNGPVRPRRRSSSSAHWGPTAR